MSKVTFKINLSDLVSAEALSELSSSSKKNILKDINEFVIDKILLNTGRGISAVDGAKWDDLSPEYKKFKTKSGGVGRANLELSGDMLDALKGYVRSDDELEIGIFKKSEALKADGHCHTGVFGESKLPLRQFLPNEDNGENLNDKIMRDVVSLANRLVDDSPKKRSNISELVMLAKEILNDNNSQV